MESTKIQSCDRTMIKTCSICAKPFEVELGPDGEILSGAYFGVVLGHEYWECQKCSEGLIE